MASGDLFSTAEN
nr:TPA_asm: M94 uORF 2 [Murid betaherpesvirus 1]DBA07854.1 TPA_asm: M94 uORF 2 [Murid betaherpesvirus 1]